MTATVSPSPVPSVTTVTEDSGFARSLLSFVMGLGFTGALFFGIAYHERSAPAEPEPALEDLKVAILPIQPPPIPVKPMEAPTEVPPMPGFDLSPAESPVKIAVSPPDLSAILPEDLSKAPPTNAVISPYLANYKPKLDISFDTEHIYQVSEVDRGPAVLDRADPKISQAIRENAKQLRVTLLVVINANGSIGNIRVAVSSGNQEFDLAVAESFKGWVFSPALKGGKTVRCLVKQVITVRWSGGSHFSA